MPSRYLVLGLQDGRSLHRNFQAIAELFGTVGNVKRNPKDAVHGQGHLAIG